MEPEKEEVYLIRKLLVLHWSPNNFINHDCWRINIKYSSEVMLN